MRGAGGGGMFIAKHSVIVFFSTRILTLKANASRNNPVSIFQECGLNGRIAIDKPLLRPQNKLRFEVLQIHLSK